MDPERQRIQEDLLGLVQGEVRCDDVFIELYSSDASIYQIRPLGVVRPRNTADVVACVQFAAERQIPLHARGAGTGLAGESLGPGLILDFSHSMRRILQTDESTVRVQAGTVLGILNQHLKSQGRMFGPDPAMSHVTTMGSVVAIDASGSHWLRYGSARHRVQSLQVVLANGEVAELSRHPGKNLEPGEMPEPQIDPAKANPLSPKTSSVPDIAAHVAALIERETERIAAHTPKSRVNRSGYVLGDVLEDDQVHLARLLSGSEGTLGLITEITVETEPIPVCRGAALLWFNSLERAARAVQEILPMQPGACDLMDRRHLSLAREIDVRYELLIPGTSEAVLLVEFDGETDTQVRAQLEKVVDRVVRKKKLAVGAHLASDDEDVDLYWQLARRFVPTLYRLRGSARPLPFVEDIAVPPEALPDFLIRVQNVLKRVEVNASLFAHAGHGQLHIRPFLDLGNQGDVRKMRQLADDLYREVFEVGGSISGEHGDGLSRTPYLAQQYGPLCDVFREVKRIFDPQGILNPGKIVPTEPTRATDNLRPVSLKVDAKTEPLLGSSTPVEPGTQKPGTQKSVAPENKKDKDTESNQKTSRKKKKTPGPSRTETVSLQLHWDPEEMALAARNCNGCGACRSQLSDVRMCPIFRFAPREEASPRAKANLVRSILTGELDAEWLGRDELKEIADLCVHCHQCRLECPASVDIPKLMVEAKGSYVQTNGLSPSDWLLTRLDFVTSVALRFQSVSNWALGNRKMRWLLEKLFGIAQGRKLPRLARHSFLQWAAKRRLTRPAKHRGAKVVYFVDTYANYFDPQLAQALISVLEHNGVAVYVHPLQQQAAMPMIAYGAIDKARSIAAKNVSLLAEAVRHGYTILATEPSATLCLTHEYQMLLNDDEVDLVAKNTLDACQYLWRMHHEGKLQLDFAPQNMSLLYHMPCHLKALDIGSPGENLLRLVPGVQIERIERGCSGMAGTYGLKRENYRNSLRAGWGLISAMRERQFQAGVTECSTCKMQMEQGVSKPTIHPIKLLALSYGLMPEIADLLTASTEEFVVT